MARPKKEETLAHSHKVNLRFTDTQYETITEAAKQADLSLSEYIRRQLMKGKIIAKYEIVVDVPELKKLIAEFGKIGSNLNQIARHFNSGGIHSQEMRSSINQGIADIYEMKYAVLKMAGDFRTAATSEDAAASKGESNGNTETHSK